MRGEILMKDSKQKLKEMVEVIALKSARLASGTASANFFGQPKEPKNLKSILKK